MHIERNIPVIAVEILWATFHQRVVSIPHEIFGLTSSRGIRAENRHFNLSTNFINRESHGLEKLFWCFSIITCQTLIRPSGTLPKLRVSRDL